MRLRSQEGFGLIELLMAMVMLNIGILAIVAAFNSGAVTLNRASRISTAAALADQQMELYRAIPYASIALDAKRSDDRQHVQVRLDARRTRAYSATRAHDDLRGAVANECNASRSIAGANSPDRKRYRVDTYIILSTTTTSPPTPTNGRPVKIVTVVVRDGGALTARPLVRIASTFDQSTG